MHFCFLKPDLAPSTLGTPTHFAGGQHGFLCAAAALAGAGHDVHLLYAASKPHMLLQVISEGAMASLQCSPGVEGLATWLDHAGLRHHVSLSDAAPSTQQQLSAAMAGLCAGAAGPVAALCPVLQRLLDQCGSLLEAWRRQQQQQQQQQQQEQAWVVLDADGSQAPPRGCSSSIMEACAAAWGPSRLALLVQNIHFLPLGPQGTAPRRQALLAAWAGLGSVWCVSSFVARYVLAHAAPLGLQPHRVGVAHYAAFGAFGGGPFPDHGAATAQHLPWLPAAQPPPSGDGGTAAAREEWRPTVGCLKLTPEKGAQLFLQLAAAMPELRFLGVCGDPAALLAQYAAGACAPPRNLVLRPPGAVDEVLQHVSVLVAPSVWEEAYGMAVTDGVLRGVPVIVSDRGGLAEAALGCAAAVVPVRAMQLPAETGTGQPAWRGRAFPPQDAGVVAAWADVVRGILASRDLYEACSRAGREAGARLVGHSGQQLRQLVAWLRELGAAPWAA